MLVAVALIDKPRGVRMAQELQLDLAAQSEICLGATPSLERVAMAARIPELGCP